MNMNEAISKAGEAARELETILGDLMADGTVEILIAGASGAGFDPACTPNVGVHLSVTGDKAAPYVTEILKRAAPIRESGIPVIVYPKRYP